MGTGTNAPTDQLRVRVSPDGLQAWSEVSGVTLPGFVVPTEEQVRAALSEKEIEAFVTFSESEAGKWYYQTVSSAFLDTLQQATENIGAVFVAALQAQPSS